MTQSHADNDPERDARTYAVIGAATAVPSARATEKLFKRSAAGKLTAVKRWRFQAILCVVFCLATTRARAAEPAPLSPVGVASVDITPRSPVRLSGYAARTNDSQEVAQHLYAKAIAFGSDDPAVLVTVDNCGVPASVRREVLSRLQNRLPVPLRPERFALCSTHTHSAPWLEGYLPNLFYPPLSAEQKQRVHLYTRDLVDALDRVVMAALEDRRPATLALGFGKAGFAANRRTKGGPVDHRLPALFIVGPEGKLRGVLGTYACHCTTVTGEFNQVCGDWAGFAAEFFQSAHPGAIALISAGCGADANPSPRPGFELARSHGREIATALDQIWSAGPRPLAGKLDCRSRDLTLPFDALPTRAEWEKRSQQTNQIGQQARLNLERLDRGETLPTSLPYLVQTWTFGNALAMVFLPGEVVVDYSLRLQTEFDASRLWVHGYANDVPCYIPSERILREGGYEGEGAMVYYDRPARFAAGIEDRIIGTVRDLLPASYLSPKSDKPIIQNPTTPIRSL